MLQFITINLECKLNESQSGNYRDRSGRFWKVVLVITIFPTTNHP